MIVNMHELNQNAVLPVRGEYLAQLENKVKKSHAIADGTYNNVKSRGIAAAAETMAMTLTFRPRPAEEKTDNEIDTHTKLYKEVLDAGEVAITKANILYDKADKFAEKLELELVNLSEEFGKIFKGLKKVNDQIHMLEKEIPSLLKQATTLEKSIAKNKNAKFRKDGAKV
jgi:vacuolar-type H+-ATPase subunit I/STV1